MVSQCPYEFTVIVALPFSITMNHARDLSGEKQFDKAIYILDGYINQVHRPQLELGMDRGKIVVLTILW